MLISSHVITDLSEQGKCSFLFCSDFFFFFFFFFFFVLFCFVLFVVVVVAVVDVVVTIILIISHSYEHVLELDNYYTEYVILLLRMICTK